MMAPLHGQLLRGGGVTLLFLLIAIALYAYLQTRYLSLPIPQSIALLTVLLPACTGLSAYSLSRFNLAKLGRTRPTLYVILILAFQLVYETIIATLSLTHLVPGSTLDCGLNEQWMSLWRAKDANAIKRIQDSFDCCGFNSVHDRAWPFPSGPPGQGVDHRACARSYGRTQACGKQWRQSEQINAGLFFTVAVVILVTKLVAAIAFFTTSQGNFAGTPWFRRRQISHARTDQGEGGRFLTNGGEPGPEYHDDDEAGAGRTSRPAADESRQNGPGPRVEPSGLVGPAEVWQN